MWLAMALVVVLDTVGTLGSMTVTAVTRETHGLGRFAVILGQLVISIYKLAEEIGASREQRVTDSSIGRSYDSDMVEQQLMLGGSGRKRGHSGEATPTWRLCTCATDYLS
ncbi:hypothetical protein NL676_028418 [Syzygium grande]|nr:hypothetical protein NL676_028418 [Syzygium grande]